MAIAYNPSIPVESLILAYDAGNTKSYSGAGATWSDLSGNGRNATWTNGSGSYSYTSSQGGYFSSTYGYATTNIGNSTYTALTFAAWVYMNTNSYVGIVFNRGSSGNTTGMSFSQSGNALGYHWNDDIGTYNYNDSGLIIPTSTWCFCGLSVSPTTAIFCLNGSTSTRTYTHASTSIGAGLQFFSDAAGGRYLIGRMATAAIFSRAFTATQLTQMYFALRGRFGV